MIKTDFSKFYSQNINRIYRYVFFRTGQDHDQCQDLVSEIFMKALKHFDQYDPNISESAWIYRIAQNHLANFFRDRKVHVDLETVAAEIVGEHGMRTLEKKEDTEQLWQGIQELTEDEQRLVTMKYLEGYSYKEMSEMLEKTTDALKMGTFRAMKRLRTCLIKNSTSPPTKTYDPYSDAFE